MMDTSPTDAAVIVRDAYKYYGPSKKPKVVLDRLNMTVPQGTIYGLLGASGCGKTTLLSCIVGRRRLKSGHIWSLGGTPGTRGSGVPGPRIGYMPQDIALFGDFTIRDTMFYFGKIFGMSKEEVVERTLFLCNLLDLPPQDRFVCNLSGGQQRRVSFAAALLHDPELLILDEPTVGVDPVLRKRIWDHLMSITRLHNKTVIITTHYIEEARQAHTIGLMRNGKLLAEDSPAELLSLYNCGTLEEVFLLLSRKQGPISSDDLNASDSEVTPQRNQQSPISPAPVPVPEPRRMSLESVTLHDHSMALQNRLKPTNNSTATLTSEMSMNSPRQRIRRRKRFGKMDALLSKNFLRYWRSASILAFIFGFPLVQLGAFFLAIGHDPQNLPLAIVNDEVPFRAGSMPATFAYESEDRCKGLVVPGCNMTRLSCRFLHTFSPTFLRKRYYVDQGSALAAVKAGHVWGALVFGSNFSEALSQRNETGKDTPDDVIEMGQLEVSLDMSDRQIGLLLKKEILETYKKFFKSLLVDCDMSPKYGETPVTFNDPIYGVENPTFTLFMAPGVILTVVFFLSTGITCTTMISEVHDGIWDRALVTGITAIEILMSHVITQIVVLVAQTIECLIIAIFIFGMDSNGSWLLVTLLTILEGFCGMCFGFLISIVCDNISAANYLSIGSFYPMILLCGVMWPLEGMPNELRIMSLQLPLTRSTDAMRNIVTKGWGLEKEGVYAGFLAPIIWSAALLVACFVGLKIKKG